jgi:hypothetical protein
MAAMATGKRFASAAADGSLHFKTSISNAMSHIFTASLRDRSRSRIIAILFVPQIQLRGRGPQNAKGAGAEAQPPVPVAD